MTPLARTLTFALVFLPAAFACATFNYDYGADEYVTVSEGLSPEGKYAITAHGDDDLGCSDPKPPAKIFGTPKSP